MEAKKKLLTYAGLKALEDELEENREIYQRMQSTMQQKMNRETLKHVSKNWKQFLRMQKL